MPTPVFQTPNLSSYMQAQNQMQQGNPWQSGMANAQQQGQMPQLEDLIKKIPRHILLQLLNGDLDKHLNNVQLGRGIQQNNQAMQENLRFRDGGPQQWNDMPSIPQFGRYM